MRLAGSGQDITYSTLDRFILSENCPKHISRQKQIVYNYKKKKKKWGDQGPLAGYPLVYRAMKLSVKLLKSLGLEVI